MYAPLLRFMFECGLRIGEATGHKWKDFDKKAKELHVRRQFTKAGRLEEMTKTSAGRRTVWLTTEFVDYLALVRQEQQTRGLGTNDDPMFPGERGNHIGHSNFRNRFWYDVLTEAKLPRLNPHQSRHAFVSKLMAIGLSLDEIARLAGHSSTKVTERIYGSWYDRARRFEDQRRRAEEYDRRAI